MSTLIKIRKAFEDEGLQGEKLFLAISFFLDYYALLLKKKTWNDTECSELSFLEVADLLCDEYFCLSILKENLGEILKRL